MCAFCGPFSILRACFDYRSFDPTCPRFAAIDPGRPPARPVMTIQQFLHKFDDVPRFQIEHVSSGPLLFVVHAYDVVAFQKIMNAKVGAVVGSTMILSADQTWQVQTTDLGRIHVHLTHSPRDFDMAVFYYKYGKDIAKVLKSFNLNISPTGLWFNKNRKLRITASKDPAKICEFLGIPFPVEEGTSPRSLAALVNNQLRQFGTRDLRTQAANALMEPLDILHMQWLEKNKNIKEQDAKIIKPHGIISGMIEHYACAFLQYIEDTQDVLTAGEFLETSSEGQLVSAFKRFVNSFSK